MRAAVLLAAALAAAGCGGGPGREEAVDTATRWVAALAERDTEAACALMDQNAVEALRKRAGLNPQATCVGAVRVYGDTFEPGVLEQVLEIGLEAEGTVREDEIGVFPVSGPHELQVVLMRRGEGEWKVSGSTLRPVQ